jgi:GTPase SAR1 family protein
MKREKKNITKSEYYAKRILKRCHVHDYDSGGVFSLITGMQGCGKTSVMLSFIDYTLRQYPNEKVFFSNTYYAPLQSIKIGPHKHHIMIQKDGGVTFHDRRKKLKQVYPMITEFIDMDDLWDKALPGICNCIFFGNRYKWMDFLHYVRSVGEWVHVYIDELSEISPAFTKGRVWKTIQEFSKDMKEIRKCMINCHTNTQSVADIDHRIRSKVMIRIYLPGARKENISRITQKALDNLEENSKCGNQAYLEMAGKFCTTRFKDIYKPHPQMQWEARINGK